MTTSRKEIIENTARAFEGFGRFMQLRHGWDETEFVDAMANFKELEKVGHYPTIENLFEALDAGKEDLKYYLDNPNKLATQKIQKTNVAAETKISIFIRWHLKKKYWQQKHLAARLGTSSAYISGLIISPASNPNTNTINKICMAFGLTMKDYDSFDFLERKRDLVRPIKNSLIRKP